MKFMPSVLTHDSSVLCTFSLILWHHQQPFMCYFCAAFPRGPLSAASDCDVNFFFVVLILYLWVMLFFVCAVMLAAHSKLYPYFQLSKKKKKQQPETTCMMRCFSVSHQTKIHWEHKICDSFHEVPIIPYWFLLNAYQSQMSFISISGRCI